MSCAAAMRAIDLALDDLRVPDSGLALSRLSQLSGLGQTPFASKVIAFLSPSTSGVYDKWISKGLATANWALCPTPRDIRSGVGQVSQPGIQRKYQNWCFFLERVQTELNRFGWLWQNTETTPQQWRAIDVERALFQVYKNQAQIQMPAKTPSTGTQQGATMNIKVKTACKTIARGDVFSYSGDPSTGTDIFFGAQPHCVHVTSKDYAFIINQFVTRQVVIGASHTSPPAGSLGEWLIRNLPGRPVITSYVAAILVDTGWAVKVNSHAIKFL